MPAVDIPNDPLKDLIPLSEFRKMFRRPVSYVTIHNWRTKGVLNRETRKRVKLPTIRTPQGHATTKALYTAFLREINSD
jgi:hypothetical protein